jgi:tRNA-(ms[2]io[6]A)-hydroxylase
MISEAHHYSLFLKLARQYGKNEKTVNEKWEALLEYESQLMTQLGKKETIHG